MDLPLRYLYDDRKLRERALVEFVRALRDDRLIAITGSMADEALGYPSWKTLERGYAAIAANVADQFRPHCTGRPALDLLDTIVKHAEALCSDEPRLIEPTVRFGIIRECFVQFSRVAEVKRRVEAIRLQQAREARADPKGNSDGPTEKSPLNQFRHRVAELFAARVGESRPAAIGPLLEGLGITRIATLNYDFELERALMLRRDESARSAHFLDFVGDSNSGRAVEVDRIGRMRRTMGDGFTVESDIVDRERPDRLIEFAIGSSPVNRRILHLHGRADLPRSMVVTAADYDLRYRRDDLFRNPFEHGMRVLFAGNPVLFVGLGMREKELNDFLQYFVSNTPYRRMAPAFLVWDTLDEEDRAARTPEQVKEFVESRRLDYLQRLGVQVIFDVDMVGPMTGGADLDWPERQRLEHRNALGPEERRQIRLDALRETLKKLPPVVDRLKHAARRTGDGWRSLGPRIGGTVNAAAEAKKETPVQEPQPVRLWGTPDLQRWARKQNRDFRNDFRPDLKAVRGRAADGKDSTEDKPSAATYHPLLVGPSEPGSGRGGLSERIAQFDPRSDFRVGNWVVRATEVEDRLLINAGFSYDSDAMLSAIAEFLRRRAENSVDPFVREKGFADGTLFYLHKPALVIINGIDRFFAFDGQPLSAELDHLLRCVQPRKGADVQWLIFGTERIRPYFETLSLTTTSLSPLLKALDHPPKPSADKPAANSLLPVLSVNSRYLDCVSKRFAERSEARHEDALSAYKRKRLPREPRGPELTDAALARIEEARPSDRNAVRRTFFGAYLAPTLLQSLNFNCPATFEVLRTLAFIGSPVEAVVLLHAPKVAAMLDECRGRASPENFLRKVLGDLRDLRLILPIAPSPRTFREEESWLWHRYGLHRSLANELRERHGAPISEAKLSATFNMSLFVAQPGDSYIPKETFHDELGELVDRLAGAWKDSVATDAEEDFPIGKEDFLVHEEARSLVFHPENGESAYRTFVALTRRRSSACLRAALAVMRGYYSTSNLLTLGRHSGLVGEHRSGALSEHAERLDRMLKSFGKIATARKIFRERLKEKKAEQFPAVRKWLGPEPLYADDLVWLHNERGVVKLVQGHLYDARRSFTLALDANETHLERGHRGHNWRRISVNLVGLLIERGRLDRAERRIDEIEASVDQAPWPWPRGEPVHSETASSEPPETATPCRRVQPIQERFASAELPNLLCGSAEFTREEILIVALTTSYRALIAHMRGQHRDADALYVRGTRMLRHLKEMRAYSIFQRHYATLGRYLKTPEQAKQEAELAIAAADSVKQLDISHRARIVRSAQIRSDPASDAASRRMALEQLHRALDYAALADAYRVRIEASSSLAKEMRESGDYDTALRYASDALAIASRYGHSLHKISLRVEIGRIFMERGDPQSGDALLQSAHDAAMRSGHHRTVERVEKTRQIDVGRRVPLGETARPSDG